MVNNILDFFGVRESLKITVVSRSNFILDIDMGFISVWYVCYIVDLWMKELY